MSDLAESLKQLKFDNRMTKWNMRQKLLTDKEYRDHLKQLEDVSHLQAKSEPESE